MEAITQLVADSLARHGFDRPVDPRRLQWSRWSRCDTPHSLLVVPSKPGIFALAEEIMDLGPGNTPAPWTDREGHDFSRAVMPARNSPASAAEATDTLKPLGGAALQRCDSIPPVTTALAAEVAQRRLLAVLQFSEDDDMAFTLDRMFTCVNPMRARLATGRCFLRFVVIEDQAQRRSICAALNQWILNSAEKATGIASDFSSSLEVAHVGRAPSPATADISSDRVGRTLLSDSAVSISKSHQAPPLKPDSIPAVLNSGAAKNLHCPHPLPSGF